MIGVLSTILICGGMTIWFFSNLGYLSFALVSELEEVQVQVPSDGFSTYYLLPKNKSDVFRFKYATLGRYYNSQRSSTVLDFGTIEVSTLFVAREGEDGNVENYNFVFEKGAYVLSKIEDTSFVYSRMMYLGYNMFKGFLLLLAGILVSLGINKLMNLGKKIRIVLIFLSILFILFVNIIAIGPIIWHLFK